MDSIGHTCTSCEKSIKQGYPFCPACGELSPSSISSGDLAVEIQEVPSKILRTNAVSLIRSWFPEVDLFEADTRLFRGRSLLASGIDEESAERLIRALKAINIEGTIVPGGPKKVWEQLWNPGLILSAAALIGAPLFGGLTAFLLLLVALVAPIAVAAFRMKYRRPLVSGTRPGLLSEGWRVLAGDYAEVVKGLSVDDRSKLASIMEEGFDLRNRLKDQSLPAAAAGSEMGDLYVKLREILSSAVRIGHEITKFPEEAQRLRGELDDLFRLLEKTVTWFGSLDQDYKQTSRLSDELDTIILGIDNIVREVRTKEPHTIQSQQQKLVE
ncbi:hypothetical protein [Desulfomonile tiedjei]|uniref:Uncharacterized protein n=1 Tax=Desulfomonile tiedjei (strain ATCC 49306 / DSM 6799 / DCB-1) TaxID=706587 RepID=I4C6B4_DESTA|nr:hypothetical protein [Desulfomonile tiedjei]AFM25105.1 hypothetical protein Desti_2423 [Desulfomonile tiedjei DSM 6799]